MYSYAKKAKLKTATGVNTSTLASKSDSASLKAEIVVDKSKSVPVHLNKLSNVLNNEVVK